MTTFRYGYDRLTPGLALDLGKGPSGENLPRHHQQGAEKHADVECIAEGTGKYTH